MLFFLQGYSDDETFRLSFSKIIELLNLIILIL